jgi:transcriptional regulator with XRE-family HTH domain
MPVQSGATQIEGVPSGDPDIDTLLIMVATLQRARKEQGLTLRDLAKRMNVSLAHLSRAERGLAQPGLVVLLRWFRALDLDFEAIYRQSRDTG